LTWQRNANELEGFVRGTRLQTGVLKELGEKSGFQEGYTGKTDISVAIYGERGC